MFAEFYHQFGLNGYPFNTFTTEDEKENQELFVEPIDYSLIKDAFKNSRTIIMAGNRGTGKRAIVFDLMRNAPTYSFVLYVDDFSSLSEYPRTNDFYKMLCENLINSLMSHAIEIKKGISHLPYPCEPRHNGHLASSASNDSWHNRSSRSRWNADLCFPCFPCFLVCDTYSFFPDYSKTDYALEAETLLSLLQSIK